MCAGRELLASLQGHSHVDCIAVVYVRSCGGLIFKTQLPHPPRAGMQKSQHSSLDSVPYFLLRVSSILEQFQFTNVASGLLESVDLSL